MKINMENTHTHIPVLSWSASATFVLLGPAGNSKQVKHPHCVLAEVEGPPPALKRDGFSRTASVVSAQRAEHCRGFSFSSRDHFSPGNSTGSY